MRATAGIGAAENPFATVAPSVRSCNKSLGFRVGARHARDRRDRCRRGCVCRGRAHGALLQ